MHVSCEARLLVKVGDLVLMRVCVDELQRTGKRLLSLPGGNVRATRHVEAAEQLSRLGVALGPRRELQFTINLVKLDAFYKWYRSGEGVESDAAWRELQANMVNELQLLSHSELRASYLTGYCPLAFKTGGLPCAPGRQPAVYLVDVYEVCLPEAVTLRLFSQSHNDQSMIEFVSVNEIRNGGTERSVIPEMYAHFFD